LKHVILTVTNDLTHDQRMHRICNTLAQNGYQVTLVGRQLKPSTPLKDVPFQQVRLSCWFHRGFLFYTEYNIRLFFFLLSRKMDCVCAIDLDTILPCLFISKLKSVKRVYDAHEYFTELKEVIKRPVIYRIWKTIEKFAVPQFRYGYTVSPGITQKFQEQYKRHFITIRNLPVDTPSKSHRPEEKTLFFGGMVNEARGFEVLIPAMKQIAYPLIIAGDGNFMDSLKNLIQEHGVENRVILKGLVSPAALRELAEQATLGIGLAEQEGLNQFLALPNKFFDYMHAGLPQLTMNFPEYAKLNSKYNIAVLVDNLDENEVAMRINAIMQDDALLQELRSNCTKAKKELNWQEEEKKLLAYYWAICHSS